MELQESQMGLQEFQGMQEKGIFCKFQEPNIPKTRHFSRFGIGERTGVGLPGETAGLLLPVDKWSQSSARTFAFGQGYSLTAMQATSVFAAVANDGVRVVPTLIAGMSDADGHYTSSTTRPGVRVISPATARTMRLMMEGVVSAGGTAPAAQIVGYRVAGKTGTANRVDNTCSCYRGYTVQNTATFWLSPPR